MAVGELYLPTQRELAAYVTSGDELHMAHNFFLLAQPWDAAAYRATIDEWQELLAPHAWPAWCLGNHDHSRIATRLGPARARVVAVLLITLRGTPFIYQGDELGLPDVADPARARRRRRRARPPAGAAAVGATVSRRARRRFHHRRAVAADHSRGGAAERDDAGGRSALDAARCTARCWRCGAMSPPCRTARSAGSRPAPTCSPTTREHDGTRVVVC